jgi:hypothetical protein
MVLTGHVQYNGQKRFEDGKYVWRLTIWDNVKFMNQKWGTQH